MKNQIQQEYLSFKAKVDRERTTLERLADWLTVKLGSIEALVIHLIVFVAWIVINLGFTPIQVFDPYPFGLLTMLVSLEAIFLSLFVLISENREQRINDVREELNLVLTKIIEKKIDALTLLVARSIRGRKSRQVKEALEPVDIETLEVTLKEEVGK